MAAPKSYTALGVLSKDSVILAANVDDNFEFYELQENLYACIISQLNNQHPRCLLDIILPILKATTLKCGGRRLTIETVAENVGRYLYKHREMNTFDVLLGGVDAKGAQICHIMPDGFRSFVPYAAIGAGKLQALAITSISWRINMSSNEALELVNSAISAVTRHSRETAAQDFDYLEIPTPSTNNIY